MLDIRTLSILSVAIIFGFGVALALFCRVAPQRGGPRWFAAAFGCLAVGVLLLGIRDRAPDFVTIIVANGLVAAGFVGLWRGVRALAGRAPRAGMEAAVLIVFFAGMAYWTYPQPDFAWRVVIFSFMTGAMSFLALQDSIRFARSGRGRAGGVLIAVFALFTVYSILRAIATPLAATIADFMHAGNFQASSFLVLIFGSAALAFAIVWATLAEMTDELAAANRSLVRSNQELERFARVVSHDLRDPLATARGYADLLLGRHHDELPDKPRGHVAEIVSAMDRCMRLVDDVLLLSRLKSEARTQEAIRLGDICAEAVGNLSAAVARSGARIEIAPLPEIVGAHGQIVRLLQNLVGNSIRYRHPDRIPEIRIEAARDGAAWRIAVIDNGRGFDAAPRGSSPHPDSTGLGLSICRQIVENHGGRLWIDSVPGHGTTVSFTVASGPGGR